MCNSHLNQIRRVVAHRFELDRHVIEHQRGGSCKDQLYMKSRPSSYMNLYLQRRQQLRLNLQSNKVHLKLKH